MPIRAKLVRRLADPRRGFSPAPYSGLVPGLMDFRSYTVALPGSVLFALRSSRIERPLVRGPVILPLLRRRRAGHPSLKPYFPCRARSGFVARLLLSRSAAKVMKRSRRSFAPMSAFASSALDRDRGNCLSPRRRAEPPLRMFSAAAPSSGVISGQEALRPPGVRARPRRLQFGFGAVGLRRSYPAPRKRRLSEGCPFAEPAQAERLQICGCGNRN